MNLHDPAVWYAIGVIAIMLVILHIGEAPDGDD